MEMTRTEMLANKREMVIRAFRRRYNGDAVQVVVRGARTGDGEVVVSQTARRTDAVQRRSDRQSAAESSRFAHVFDDALS